MEDADNASQSHAINLLALNLRIILYVNRLNAHRFTQYTHARSFLALME